MDTRLGASEPILLAAPVRRVYCAWNFLPLNPPGTLTLTVAGVKCEPNSLSAPGAQLDIALADILEARAERWFSRWLFPLANILLLIPAVRRSFTANLTIRTDDEDYHFQVGDAVQWEEAIQATIKGSLHER